MSDGTEGPTGLDINGRCADPSCPCQLSIAARRRRSFWRGFRDGLSLGPLWRWLARKAGPP